MSVTPLCIQYNRKEAYWDHPEKTYFPDMLQMAMSSVRGAWHWTAPGCVLSKVTCLAHITAVSDAQHNTVLHSPSSIWKIHLAIISAAIVSGSHSSVEKNRLLY